MMMYPLILGGLLVAAKPDVPRAEPKAAHKPKGALPMNVDPGRFQKATAALRVKLQQSLGADKYAWYTVARMVIPEAMHQESIRP